MKINEKIVERRKALKLTQREIAEKINVSDKTISKWETGSTYPPIDIIPTLAKVLNIEIEAFFEKSIEEEVTREEKYDYSKIGTFKSKVVISIVVWILGIFLSYYGNYMILHDDRRFGIILLLFGVLAVLGSITLFFLNVINFTNFYKDKYYILEYDKASAYWIIFFYIFVIITIYIRIPIFHIIDVNSKGNMRILMLLSLVNVIIILLIFRKFHFHLKMNMRTKIIIVIFVLINLSYFSLSIAGGSLPFTISNKLIIPSFILSFIIGYQVEYNENK